jgi:hypothetical protein
LTYNHNIGFSSTFQWANVCRHSPFQLALFLAVEAAANHHVALGDYGIVLDAGSSVRALTVKGRCFPANN